MEYFIKTVEGNSTNLSTVLNLNMPRGNYFKACGMTFRWVGKDPDGSPRFVLVSGRDAKESAYELSSECRRQNYLYEMHEDDKRRKPKSLFSRILTFLIG